ncbi:hypothetical protein EXIGLDRAFT_774104 [Exidia glandulosa HHB12029]|uniref:Uncharacterized protein n=1 Tax=Exidia glandulosa HHB12029 TaxID=1314781 RepID=A0A165EHY4_EXIGL|nr:hypothetical protein EXIGLDRAFT_774104 [Exidia glandulosa HHB12029]
MISVANLLTSDCSPFAQPLPDYLLTSVSQPTPQGPHNGPTTSARSDTPASTTPSMTTGTTGTPSPRMPSTPSLPAVRPSVVDIIRVAVALGDLPADAIAPKTRQCTLAYEGQRLVTFTLDLKRTYSEAGLSTDDSDSEREADAANEETAEEKDAPPPHPPRRRSTRVQKSTKRVRYV